LAESFEAPLVTAVHGGFRWGAIAPLPELGPDKFQEMPSGAS